MARERAGTSERRDTFQGKTNAFLGGNTDINRAKYSKHNLSVQRFDERDSKTLACEWVQRVTGQPASDQTRSCEASRYNAKPKDIKQILENSDRDTSFSSHACDFWRRKLGVD